MAASWPKHRHSCSRRPFTPAEDAQLFRVVTANQGQSWEFIASHLPNRTARQCRERYANYLSPALRVAEWTPMEDALLLEKINELGRSWAAIGRFFNGRSENDIKNRWYSHLRFSTFWEPISGRYYFIDPSRCAFSVRRKRYRVKAQPNISARILIIGNPNVGKREESTNSGTATLDYWQDFGDEGFDLFAPSEYL